MATKRKKNKKSKTLRRKQKSKTLKRKQKSKTLKRKQRPRNAYKKYKKIYHGGVGEDGGADEDGGIGEDGDVCPICLDKLDQEETVEPSCKHLVHKRCIASWFAKNNKTCPTCRTELNSERESMLKDGSIIAAQKAQREAAREAREIAIKKYIDFESAKLTNEEDKNKFKELITDFKDKKENYVDAKNVYYIALTRYNENPNSADNKRMLNEAERNIQMPAILLEDTDDLDEFITEHNITTPPDYVIRTRNKKFFEDYWS